MNSIWSVGCVLVELYIGEILFDGDSESEQIQKMEEILGPLPESMIIQGTKSERVYIRNNNPHHSNNVLVKHFIFLSFQEY